MKTFKILFLFIFFVSINGYGQEKKSDYEASKKNNPEQTKDWSNIFKYDSLKFTKEKILTVNFKQTSVNFKDFSIGRIIIYFKDGTATRGSELRFKSSGYIYFSGNKRTKKKKYPIQLVKYVSISPDYIDNNGVMQIGEKFVYKKIFGVYKQLRVIKEGKVDLYMIEGWANHSNYVYKDFYVQRKSENKMTLLAKKKMSNQKFIKKATVYFKDCPELVSKINNNRYSYKELEYVVEYYNLFCN